ncbi:MAG: DUF2807 domain-containing protein [Sphingorhabdus sp.]
MKRIQLKVMAMALCVVFGGMSAHAAERKLLMAGFKNIVVEDDIEVNLTIGKAPRATVTGDKRELSRIILDRRGNTLVVRLRPQAVGNPRRPASEPLRLALSNYALENIELRGNGRINATALKNSGSARIFVLGSGEINIDNMIVDRLVATVIGNGSVKIGGGKVRRGLIEIQGGAEINASAVNFRNLEVTHEGSGTSSATVANAAKINNNGRGSITITGKGSCFIKRAGSAIIDCPKYAR